MFFVIALVAYVVVRISEAMQSNRRTQPAGDVSARDAPPIDASTTR